MLVGRRLSFALFILVWLRCATSCTVDWYRDFYYLLIEVISKFIGISGCSFMVHFMWILLLIVFSVHGTGKWARKVGLFSWLEESTCVLLWDPTNVSLLYICSLLERQQYICIIFFYCICNLFFRWNYFSPDAILSLSHHTYSRKQIYVMILIKCGIGARYTSNNYYNRVQSSFLLFIFCSRELGLSWGFWYQKREMK